MHFSTLCEWLSWIASIHISEIELGLDRVRVVADRLKGCHPRCPVIIVGGTNGKGSTVAGLEAIYRTMGYQVGAFTTPILFKHNEQVRTNGEMASDQAFCQAFEKIEAARQEISLTPFEYCTLAALLIFQTHEMDVLLLEVGLGGRLDAVNILDADVAVITSIGIDHVEWLGDTREAIAYEKAGIFRPGKPAVCGEEEVPDSLLKHADVLGTPLFCQGRDFLYQENDQDWSWAYQDRRYDHLPLAALAIQNMSTVLMTVTLLQSRLPVTREVIDKGLSNVKLMGRIQIIPGPVTLVYDVSHNPASVALLARRLREMPCQGKTHAVFSMLADKDIAASIHGVKEIMDEWYVAPLLVKRAAETETLRRAFQQAGVDKVTYSSSIGKAFRMASARAQEGDRIIVFGSFHTVADVWSLSR